MVGLSVDACGAQSTPSPDAHIDVDYYLAQNNKSQKKLKVLIRLVSVSKQCVHCIVFMKMRHVYHFLIWTQ